MAIKLGNNTKAPGDGLIGTGILFCFLGALLYLISALAGGVANGLVLFGGGVLGLLMVCAGYLKRISVAITANQQ